MNRTSIKAISWKTFFEKFIGYKSTILYIYLFGCKVYIP